MGTLGIEALVGRKTGWCQVTKDTRKQGV